MLCSIMLVSAMHIPLFKVHSLMSPDRCVQLCNQCYGQERGHSAPQEAPPPQVPSQLALPSPHLWQLLILLLSLQFCLFWKVMLIGTVASYAWLLSRHTMIGLSWSEGFIPVTPSQYFLLKKPDHLLPQVSRGPDFTDCIPLGIASAKPQRSSFSSVTFV